jgi:hypothetical protein
MPYVDTQSFSKALELFAQTRDKHILLMMDNASWHTSSKLELPANISPLYQPPYSPELQPAEHLWQFSDEPLLNQCFDSIENLEAALEKQCKLLMSQSQHMQRIKQATSFHWWPNA